MEDDFVDGYELFDESERSFFGAIYLNLQWDRCCFRDHLVDILALYTRPLTYFAMSILCMFGRKWMVYEAIWLH